MKICSVQGCALPSRSKGMCKKHYDVQWRPGYDAKRVEERKAYERAYRERMKDKIALYRREHAAVQKDYDHARYQTLKDKVRLRVREYQLANADKISARRAEYYKKNAAEIRASVNEYRKKHPELVRLKKAIGRSRERSAEGSHDYQQLRDLRLKQRDRCAICRTDLKRGGHKDHIVPLVLGGSNWISNIQWLCGPCNMQKNRKDPIKFMQQRGLLL